MRRFICLTMVVMWCASVASGDDCSSLMRWGVYDKYQTLNTQAHFEQLKEFFRSNTFTTRQQAQQKATDVGLDIGDVLSLSFGGKDSLTDFQLWQQELLRTTFSQVSSSSTHVQTVDKFSETLAKLIATCIEANKKGVKLFITPANDQQNFTVTAEYVPFSAAAGAAKGKLTITPLSVQCSPAGVVGVDREFGPEGVNISCKRLSDETVTAVLSTNQGSTSATYLRYVVPNPTVSFRAEPSTITRGDATVLTWSVDNAAGVELEGVGAVGLSSSHSMTPPATRTYYLKVRTLNGTLENHSATVTVNPPPPRLSGVEVWFNTTNDNKDDDTVVRVSVVCGAETVARGEFGSGTEFRDNHSYGPFALTVLESRLKSEIPTCTVKLLEQPNGSDEWHFTWGAKFSYTDGVPKNYDFGSGDVDHDRAEITKGLQ